MNWRALLPRRLKDAIKKLINCPEPYVFHLAASVKSQSADFRFLGRKFSVVTDGTTPLYDTIYEVVDFDAYQLASLPAGEPGKKVILDIGANVGVTALALSAIPGAEVHCYEPQAGNFAFLKDNISRNGAANITPVNAAVAAADGEVFFRPETVSVGGGVSREASPGSVPVKAVSLATALAEAGGELFLLKSDCEGGEYAILDQFTPETAAHVQNLTFEVHYRDERDNLENFCRRLEELGYRTDRKPDPWGRKGLDHVLARRRA